MTFAVIIFGASGDLAKRKTIPALYSLYIHGEKYKAPRFRVVGYARTELTGEEIKLKSLPFLKKIHGASEESIEGFFQNFTYISGQYDTEEGYLKLQENTRGEDLIYYLALPPFQFITVSRFIKKVIYNKQVINRLVVEKPFGRDTSSAKELSDSLSSLFEQNELYLIDHYLGKEMVKNLMILRFSNLFFQALWNRQYVDSVQIVFKESLGVEGRGGYFDEFGIIRDVMQNHMLQLLSIVAMERPASLDSEDIRNEKVKVLKCITPLKYSEGNVIIGQYTSGNGHLGYCEEETVPKESFTPTFAMAVCYIKNERWDGVPFILKCGKGLSDSKSEVRIQFKPIPGGLYHHASQSDSSGRDLPRNELVIRVQPNESIYLKLLTKKPGLAMEPLLSDLDLTYRQRFEDFIIPDAYESILLDLLRGDRQNFVRIDELEAAWKIVSPLLGEIESVPPKTYPFGSRGPTEADELLKRVGYHYHLDSFHTYKYSWPKTAL